jgi:hypothetical protein
MSSFFDSLWIQYFAKCFLKISELKLTVANHESVIATEKEMVAKKEDRLKLLESSYNELLTNKVKIFPTEDFLKRGHF